MSKATSLSTTTINHAKDAGRIVHQKAHNIHHSCAQPKFPKPAITGSIKKEHPPPTDAHAVQIDVDVLNAEKSAHAEQIKPTPALQKDWQMVLGRACRTHGPIQTG